MLSIRLAEELIEGSGGMMGRDRTYIGHARTKRQAAVIRSSALARNSGSGGSLLGKLTQLRIAPAPIPSLEILSPGRGGDRSAHILCRRDTIDRDGHCSEIGGRRGSGPAIPSDHPSGNRCRPSKLKSSPPQRQMDTEAIFSMKAELASCARLLCECVPIGTAPSTDADTKRTLKLGCSQ